MDVRRFVERYADYARELDAEYGTVEAAAWLEQYRRELPNIRAAFDKALQHEPLHESAISIALHTGWYWHESGHLDEGCALIERALTLPLNTRDAAELHRLYGMLLFAKGNYAAAIEHAQTALERGLEIEPPEPPHRYYTLFANVLLYAGQYDEAEQYYRMAVDAAQSWNRPHDLSTCRFNLGILMYECKGDFSSARRLLAQSFSTKGADEFDDALAEETLARIAFLERHFSEAVAHAQEAMSLLTKVGNTEHTLDVAMRQCVYLTLDDRLDDAIALWRNEGPVALASANPETCASALDASATLYAGSGNLEKAVAARAFLRQFRMRHHLVVFPMEQRLYDAWDFAARALLGKPVHARAVAQGESLQLSEAAFPLEA
jgi:tetratricopeptide (TPR) repeat protein